MFKKIIKICTFFLVCTKCTDAWRIGRHPMPGTRFSCHFTINREWYRPGFLRPRSKFVQFGLHIPGKPPIFRDVKLPKGHFKFTIERDEMMVSDLPPICTVGSTSITEKDRIDQNGSRILVKRKAQKLRHVERKQEDCWDNEVTYENIYEKRCKNGNFCVNRKTNIHTCRCNNGFQGKRCNMLS
mgnify:CR=1 FL=1